MQAVRPSKQRLKQSAKVAGDATSIQLRGSTKIVTGAAASRSERADGGRVLRVWPVVDFVRVDWSQVIARPRLRASPSSALRAGANSAQVPAQSVSGTYAVSRRLFVYCVEAHGR